MQLTHPDAEEEEEEEEEDGPYITGMFRFSLTLITQISTPSRNVIQY
jgi:hypothetical protein